MVCGSGGLFVLGGLSGGGVCDSQSICLWFLVNGGDYFVCGVYGEGSQDAGYGFSGFRYDVDDHCFSDGLAVDVQAETDVSV